MKTVYEMQLAPLSVEKIDLLLALARDVFGQIDEADVVWRLHNMPTLSVFLATLEDQPAAFKIGYALTSQRYYSWLGGVAAPYRRQGIAVLLMEQQHDWVFAQGFEVLETEVLQDNHPMQMLNERSGFQAGGVRFDGEPARIVYRKRGVAS